MQFYYYNIRIANITTYALNKKDIVEILTHLVPKILQNNKNFNWNK